MLLLVSSLLLVLHVRVGISSPTANGLLLLLRIIWMMVLLLLMSSSVVLLLLVRMI